MTVENQNKGVYGEDFDPMSEVQMKGFKDLLNSSDISKDAKAKLDADLEDFAKQEGLAQSQPREHEVAAKDTVEVSMNQLEKSNKLSDKIQKLTKEIEKIKEQEALRLLDLNSSIKKAIELEHGRKFDDAIAELEKVTDFFNKPETQKSFNSEYGVRLDQARGVLATLYVLSKEYNEKKKELDEKRAQIVMQLERNEVLRQLCTNIATESAAKPKAFGEIKNFDEWFDPKEIGFKPAFFELPLEVQQPFVAELSAKVNELQINSAVEKSPRPEKIFFEAQQKMNGGDILATTELLLEYRRAAGGSQEYKESAAPAIGLASDKSNPFVSKRTEFLEKTDVLLREIAKRHCDTLEVDLQKLLEEHDADQFKTNENIDYGVALSNLVKIRELLSTHKVLTFSQAVKQLPLSYQSSDKYDLLFFVEAAESKLELNDLTIRAVESLNELGGSTKLSRDKLDRALSKQLSSVDVTEQRKKNLRALSNEEAVKHKEEAVSIFEGQRDSIKSRLDKLDKEIKELPDEQDAKKRDEKWQEYNQLIGQMKTLTVDGSAEGEIKPTLISQSVEKACDETYRMMLRKDRYLALAQSGKVTEPSQQKLLEQSISMDNMIDKDFTSSNAYIEILQTYGGSLFPTDTWHQIFQTSCMTVFEIAQMSVGAGFGSFVEHGLTKLAAKQLAKGGLRKFGLKLAIGGAKAAGEGFGMTAATKTIGAMAMLAEGKDPTEAYDGFAKEWAQSTLMFASINVGNALISNTLGRLAVSTEKGAVRASELTFKQNPKMWLAYHSGQLGTEVETLYEVDHMGAALGLSPNATDDELQAKLSHLTNVLKFRAGGKVWNSTAIGHDIHMAQQELEMKTHSIEREAGNERVDNLYHYRNKDIGEVGVASPNIASAEVERRTRKFGSGGHWNREMAEQIRYEKLHDLKEKADNNELTHEQYKLECMRVKEQFEKEKMGAIIIEAEDFIALNPNSTAEEIYAHLTSLSWYSDIHGGGYVDVFTPAQDSHIQEVLRKFTSHVKKIDKLEKQLSTKGGFEKWREKAAKSKGKLASGLRNIKFEDLEIVRNEADCLTIYLSPEKYKILYPGNTSGVHSVEFHGVLFIKKRFASDETREHERSHSRFSMAFAGNLYNRNSTYDSIYGDRVSSNPDPKMQRQHAAVQSLALNELFARLNAGQGIKAHDDPSHAFLYPSGDPASDRSKYFDTQEGNKTQSDFDNIQGELEYLIEAGTSLEKLGTLAATSTSLQEYLWNLKQIKVAAPAPQDSQPQTTDAYAETILPATEPKEDIKTTLKGMPALRFEKDLATAETVIAPRDAEPKAAQAITAELPVLIVSDTEISTPESLSQPPAQPLAPRIDVTNPGMPRVNPRERFYEKARETFANILKNKFEMSNYHVDEVVKEVEKMSQDQVRQFLDNPQSLKEFAVKLVERKEAIARDVDGFARLSNQNPVHILVDNVRSQLQLLARNESPNGKLGEIIGRLKEHDPLAYNVILKSDAEQLVVSGVLSAMIRGGEYKKTITNEKGQVVTVYMGSPIKKGGMGSLDRVGFVREGSDKLEFGAMKQAREISLKEAQIIADIQKNAATMKRVESANTVDPNEGTPIEEQAATIDTAALRDQRNRIIFQNFKRELDAQRKIERLKDSRFLRPLEIFDDKVIYESSLNSYDFEDARDRMSTPELALSLVDVIGAIQKLHKNGLFHGDIKPQNLMKIADENGVMRTKVIDNTPSEMSKLIGNSLLDPESFLADVPYTPGYQQYSPETLSNSYRALLDEGKSSQECSQRSARAIDTVEIATTITQLFGGTDGSILQNNPQLREVLEKIIGSPENVKQGDVLFAGRESTLQLMSNYLLKIADLTHTASNPQTPLAPSTPQISMPYEDTANML